MEMEKKLLEQQLTELGITYTHKSNRATDSISESIGRYSTTGDWIEEEIILHVEPDGIEIQKFQKCYNCNYCDLILDKMPVFQLSTKMNRYKKDVWLVKCLSCRKGIDFKTFKNSSDK